MAAGQVPSSFQKSDAMAGETLRSWWVEFPQGPSRLRKAILTRGRIGCSMVGLSFSVDHPFSTSFSMLVKIFFF